MGESRGKAVKKPDQEGAGWALGCKAKKGTLLKAVLSFWQPLAYIGQALCYSRDKKDDQEPILPSRPYQQQQPFLYDKSAAKTHWIAVCGLF